MFESFFCGKKVLVTGHTGFKGSWLTCWLLELGSSVVGYSKDVPTTPSMFEMLKLENRIKHYVGDVRDLDKLSNVVVEEKPDIVFHLAAQAIVSVSYLDPVETVTSNVTGTMNIMEALKNLETDCTAIIITSDKCYDNVEWVWGYRETDALGGKDVYSGSKGAAELIVKSYTQSFFNDEKNKSIKIAVARAGNVIGGGDWARDRIVADIYRSWGSGEPVSIRCPNATRPWQHVLEPLSGYLTLAYKLTINKRLHGQAYNFGPKADQNRSVIELLNNLSEMWGHKKNSDAYELIGDVPFNEAGLLKLNCDKALFDLKWEPTLDYAETVEFVSAWYTAYFNNSPLDSVTMNQIEKYTQFAVRRNREWAKI